MDHTYLWESAFYRTFSSFEGIEQETVSDFIFKNANPYPLQDFFDLDYPVVLISNEEIEELFQLGTFEGWRNFYEKYPGSQGIMELSRVGFNAEMDQAIVYMGNQQGSLSGSGNVYYLIKVNGEWVVQYVDPAWIS